MGPLTSLSHHNVPDAEQHTQTPLQKAALKLLASGPWIAQEPLYWPLAVSDSASAKTFDGEKVSRSHHDNVANTMFYEESGSDPYNQDCSNLPPSSLAVTHHAICWVPRCEWLYKPIDV